MMIIGFNFTKRYFTFPHHHSDPTQPKLLPNGELHPFDYQPPNAKDKHKPYILHQV
ncbi:UNKNOWN [Stylonychia lemnae]|uniref:Uncharacterized protein n=1 Tax=Stylonychia lemnae TaxID=5949 RepID=A0A078AGZ7_STYLE|nr:UNKNOWN [Stylonychia lemnae]|eukprot:CDW81545.1 UNKNOWN [Stylonychia lemnae]